LAEIMGQLGDDRAALVPFYLEFGADVRKVVRHLVKRRRRCPDEDEVDNLTFDACYSLAEVAGSWRPDGGALPWVWARGRIERVVDRHFGPITKRLSCFHDCEEVELVAPDDHASIGITLALLAERDEHCALLLSALDESVNEDDVEVFFRYRVQQQSGDPAPAHTVGRALGLKPPAVRQRASRARRRLAAVVARDPRFEPLGDLDLLDSGRPSATVAA